MQKVAKDSFDVFLEQQIWRINETGAGKQPLAHHVQGKKRPSLSQMEMDERQWWPLRKSSTQT